MSSPFIGNERARGQLRRLVESDRLHPCLLWEGAQGVGKATTALWLAMLANCESEDMPARPCGQCWSCRQIPKGQHPDIIHVGLDPSKAAPIISVAQAREVISQLTVKPFHARRRFVIIDPADAMTPEAANALLKTFEDPPSQTHFILVTSAPASLLLTVRSRSQRLRFAPVAEAEISSWLTAQGVDDADKLARASEGCPGRAKTMDPDAEGGMLAARDALLDALSKDVAGRLKYAETLCRGDRSKWAPVVDDTLDALGGLVRDTLAVRSGGEPFYNADQPEIIARWAARLDEGALASITDTLAEAQDRLGRYVSGRLVMDAVLADIAQRIGSHETV